MRRKFSVLLALFVGFTSSFAEESAPDKPLTRIAFGSCSKEYKPQPLWKPILADKPDLWVWLGDIVYGDANEIDWTATPPIVSLQVRGEDNAVAVEEKFSLAGSVTTPAR